MTDLTAKTVLITGASRGIGEGRARSPVNIMLHVPDLPGVVEIPLPEQYAVTPQIISAIKHVAGVSHVEEF